MRYFPTTQRPNLGGGPCGTRYDHFRLQVPFSPEQWNRREHIPDYATIKRAELVLAGERGEYRLEFPKGVRQIDVVNGDGAQTADVRDLVAIGRHTYALIANQGQSFQATLIVELTRPTVAAVDGGYRIEAQLMRYARKLQLEDRRNEQRVGRFDAWVTAVPEDVRRASAQKVVDLAGTWRVKRFPMTSVEDPARPWFDDSDWDTAEVPGRFEEETASGDVIWFRRRVDVPADWTDSSSSPPVYLQFDGVDDETYVYVNGDEVGYHCGWHEGFQFDVSEYLSSGVDNVVAVRCVVRKPHTFAYDGGMTYTFVRDYAVTAYPIKEPPLGGIFKGARLASVEHPGPVRFLPRFHPNREGAIEVRFSAPTPVGREPLVVGRQTVFTYAPPVMRYDRLRGGQDEWSVEAMAAFDAPVVFLRVAGPPETAIAVEVERYDDERTESKGVASTAFATGTDGTVIFALGSDVVVHVADRAEYDANIATWERRVYGRSLPVRASEAERAYHRTLKQVLTLVSKTVPGEISGLFTDLVKYPIFWLRDSAISIPGTLYGGDLANAGAVAAAGDIYSRAKENANYTILYPDGTMRPAQRATDAPPLAVYSIYKVWCTQGDAWLADHWQTVVSYMDYLDHVEREFANPPDGIIRSSDGDWWDYKYHNRYEREGAAFFVNVLYLRALKYASRMAEAMGDGERAAEWIARLDRGVALLNKPVGDGGLYLPDRGYFADSVMTQYDKHPNGWKYPEDLEKVTVMGAFRPIPHAIAIAEGFIADPAVTAHVIERIDRYDVTRPYPGLVQYPWYDFMGNEAIGGSYEATRFRSAWKAMPGNHTAGGRWAFAGGIIEKALWVAGAGDLGREAHTNAAGVTLLARQPARVFEDAHYSGLFRNESGDGKDAEGFYYNWGAATPMEALVEGRYGIVPQPGAVSVHLTRIPVGDGIREVEVAGGFLSVARLRERGWSFAAGAGETIRVLLRGGADEGFAVTAADGSAVPTEAGTDYDGRFVAFTLEAGGVEVDLILPGRT